MQITIDVSEHEPCEGGCVFTFGDEATADEWGISEAEAHAISFDTMRILLDTFRDTK